MAEPSLDAAAVAALDSTGQAGEILDLPTHLLDALSGVPTAMPVATGVHGDHPAGPAWTLAGASDLRRWLHELPCDHGPDNPATNPHRFTDLPHP